MNDGYDDIINMEHHRNESRKPMSMMGRAGQFAPFSALTGHDAALAETARLTFEKIELTPDEQEKLSRRLVYAIENQIEVEITYFSRDRTKTGGVYLTASGRIKKIDEYSGQIVLADGHAISLNDVLTIEI